MEKTKIKWNEILYVLKACLNRVFKFDLADKSTWDFIGLKSNPIKFKKIIIKINSFNTKRFSEPTRNLVCFFLK
jgi:hypothetical protein